MKPLVGILGVAAVATLGDWVWFELGVRHRATAGVLHGAVLLGSVGLVLGWMSGRVLAGLLAGIAAGVGGAAAYYALAALGPRGMNYGAMVAAWAAVWIVLALVDGRWLRRPARRSWAESLTRGALAAVASGAAFWLVLPIIWGAPDGGTRNYLLQFGAWALAWGPGILAIAGYRKRYGAPIA